MTRFFLENQKGMFSMMKNESYRWNGNQKHDFLSRREADEAPLRVLIERTWPQMRRS
jgi:hypothetical protein